MGGETAEMPGMYHGGDYDLAGFCVGVVERDKIIDGSKVAVGDRLIALPSSGPHSNGYSLIRKIIEITGADLMAPFEGSTLGEVLLTPTTIYNKPLLALQNEIRVHAMAHITGGGLTENIPRVLPDGCCARIELSSWQLPPIFEWLQQGGNVAHSEMLRTFNCGVGMVLVIAEHKAEATLAFLKDQAIDAWQIGDIISGPAGVEFVD